MPLGILLLRWIPELVENCVIPHAICSSIRLSGMPSLITDAAGIENNAQFPCPESRHFTARAVAFRSRCVRSTTTNTRSNTPASCATGLDAARCNHANHQRARAHDLNWPGTEDSRGLNN